MKAYNYVNSNRKMKLLCYYQTDDVCDDEYDKVDYNDGIGDRTKSISI